MLLFKRLPTGEGLPLPSYATPGSAGLDICAAEDGEVAPGHRLIVPTGFNVAVAPGYEVQVRPRSGLAAKHGITVLNSPGTIDSDYRGEIKVILINHGDKPFAFSRAERIAQLVVSPVTRVDPLEVDALDDTSRGSGGFGSTGV